MYVVVVALRLIDGRRSRHRVATSYDATASRHQAWDDAAASGHRESRRHFAVVHLLQAFPVGDVDFAAVDVDEIYEAIKVEKDIYIYNCNNRTRPN